MAACSMSLEVRLKLPTYLNIYRRGYVQVLLGCVSLCLHPFSVPCCRDGESFGLHWGHLSSLSCSILHTDQIMICGFE